MIMGIKLKRISNVVRLIVGLGNPGKKYEKTRHNLGFLILDELAKELEIKFRLHKKVLSEIAKTSEIILAKPQTFMNNSGKAVQKLLTTYLPTGDLYDNLSPYGRSPEGRQLTNLIVVHDEIDLLFGTLRLSQDSGAAGHKGVKSIIAAIGKNFMRLRIGIENREKIRIPETETYVLQPFTEEEQQQLRQTIIPEALDEIEKFYPLSFFRLRRRR